MLILTLFRFTMLVSQIFDSQPNYKDTDEEWTIYLLNREIFLSKVNGVKTFNKENKNDYYFKLMESYKGENLVIFKDKKL